MFHKLLDPATKKAYKPCSAAWWIGSLMKSEDRIGQIFETIPMFVGENPHVCRSNQVASQFLVNG